MRLIWIAVGLHIVGLVIDTLFHESHTRPFSLLDMLWAHGLAYVGAILTIVGGWRLWRATDRQLAYRVSGSVVAVLGVAEAIGLAIDLVTELAASQDVVGPTIYILALGLAVVTTVVATVLSRQRQPIRSRPSAERPLGRGVRAWVLRNPAIIAAFGALIVAAGTARIAVGENSAAVIYGAVQIIAGGWTLIMGLIIFRSKR